ncbi:MAG: sugar-binding protein, partial [Verrucomicrobiales bacterium]
MNDIEPTKEFYTANKTVNPIVLDGDLSEWTGAELLADPRFYIPKFSGSDPNVEGELVNFEILGNGDWTGADDHTSAVRVLYDDENVYFGFIVTDEYHENAAASAWNGDSVQLMIANGDPENNRTIYEIKLPKATLARDELTGGVKFGLGMAINDGDEATPGQKGWGGLGAHSIVFGKHASETALVTLAAPPIVRERVQTNDIEPGKEFYTAIKAAAPIVLDGDLSEWRGAQLLADPRFSIPKGEKANGELVNFEILGDGDWTGPDDHTSAVRVVYDDENIYFGFVVTDEYHENAAASAWNGDSVQLMVANDARDAQVALYNYALGGVEGDIGEIIVNHEARPADGADTEAIV